MPPLILTRKSAKPPGVIWQDANRLMKSASLADYETREPTEREKKNRVKGYKLK